MTARGAKRSGGHLKYSRLRRWRPETGFNLQVRGRCGSFNAYADILIGFFMLATFDYAGCRRAVPNAGASGRIADAPSAMSPAPRAVRDVELAALEHVRPVEPRKQLRLQEPHAAAGHAPGERGTPRHPAQRGRPPPSPLAPNLIPPAPPSPS